MSRHPEPLDDLAQLLQFENEEQMLRQLYANHSLAEIATQLGYSITLIRSRLLRYGVKLKDRGGANNKKAKGDV